MTEIVTRQDEPTKVITFRIDQHHYCIDVMLVHEIRCWSPTTPLPQSPPYVRGLINLRGLIAPVVDLAVRLGLPSAEPTSKHVIIVVRVGSRTFGLLVDAASDIICVTPGMIHPAPDVDLNEKDAFITSVLVQDDRLTNMLSLEHILPQLREEAA